LKYNSTQLLIGLSAIVARHRVSNIPFAFSPGKIITEHFGSLHKEFLQRSKAGQRNVFLFCRKKGGILT
jgi:hypothetical protein